MPKDAKWRNRFRTMIEMLTLKGVLYTWGGQNPFGKCEMSHGTDGKCDCPRTADCSGLVLEVLKKLGKLPNAFPDMTAQSLAREYAKTTKPQPGDLVFYGKAWNHVTHVMFYYGELEYRANKRIPDAVVGMCSGRRNMDDYEARLFGGMLKFQRGSKYRRDLLGFRKVV